MPDSPPVSSTGASGIAAGAVSGSYTSATSSASTSAIGVRVAEAWGYSVVELSAYRNGGAWTAPPF